MCTGLLRAIEKKVKEKGMGVATMSFIQSREILRPAYILFMQLTR